MPYTSSKLKSLRGRNRAVVSQAVSGLLPFSPRDISGLQLWYSVRQEVGYTNGNALGTLIDWSGNGNNAVQATAGNKPTYTTGGPNSMPYALFDTTNDYMLYGSSVALLKDHTIFAVVARTNVSSFVTVFGGAAAVSSYGMALDASTIYYSPNGYASWGTTVTTSTFYIMAVSRTDVNILFYQNGVTPHGANGGSLGNNNQTLYGLAAYDNGTQQAPGMNFCEGLIYNYRLSSQQIADVFAYLNGIYAIY